MHWVGYLVYHDISNIKLKEYEFYYGYAMMCCYILPVHLNLLLSFADALCLLLYCKIYFILLLWSPTSGK